MQVTRKSHRWPFVVALVGLLVFCLTVPRYWRTVERPAGFSNQSAGFGVPTHMKSKRREATLDLADLPDDDTVAATASVPPPDMSSDEALFAQLSAGMFPTSPLPGFPTVSWPTPADVLKANSPTEAETGTTNFGEPELSMSDRLVIETLTGCQNVGRLLADYSNYSLSTYWLRNGVSALSKWRVDWNLFGAAPITPIGSSGQWQPMGSSLAGGTATGKTGGQDAASPAAESASPGLKLAGPEERLAMLPPVASQPSEQPTAAQALWAVPEVLQAQLEQLTHYRETQRWATDTLAQLHSLVDGERRDRVQAAAVLASLSSSAADAVKLAQQTEDEALQVELLRAHWGLERRLAYWTAMRDIRLAAISQTRIASRGALGPLFRDATDPTSAERKLASLSADLESYERSRDPQLGRRVAQAERELHKSTSDLDRALADAVEDNYRNANLRVAITGEMLNRYVSQEQCETREVNERIAGTPVRGQSETVSRSRVELQPAVGSWQMRLLTEGTVESQTSSTGRSKAYTAGQTQFTAQTPIVVDSDGVVHKQATAVSAETCNQLMGVSTGVDWIPLIGGFARSQVVDKYQEKRPRAKAEVEYKVASQTQARVDSRTDELVAQVQQDVKDRLTNPLAKYGIEITPLEMTTTNERLVARLRIAGSEQLAAHTPRPRALSDSLLSVQMHESALTNAAAALELNGERLSASQLQARLREKLPRLALEQPPEAPDATVFQFAAADAVRFKISDGRLEVLLSVAEFTQDNDRIRNFVVHVKYKPVVNGLTAELERDGALGIERESRGVGASERALLYNVFKVVFSEDRRLPIFKPDDFADPRLAGLMVTQFVLEDGWLGVSIGPVTGGRVAERQRSLR